MSLWEWSYKKKKKMLKIQKTFLWHQFKYSLHKIAKILTLKLIKKIFVEFRISLVLRMTMGTCWRRRWKIDNFSHLKMIIAWIKLYTLHNQKRIKIAVYFGNCWLKNIALKIVNFIIVYKTTENFFGEDFLRFLDSIEYLVAYFHVSFSLSL